MSDNRAAAAKAAREMTAPDSPLAIVQVYATRIQAAIDEAEYDNRSVIASQQLVLKEKREQIDALVKALRLLLPIAKNELNRIVAVNMTFRDNATGQAFLQAITMASAALARSEEPEGGGE